MLKGLFRTLGKSSPRPSGGGAAGADGHQVAAARRYGMKANAGRFSGSRQRHLPTRIYMLISYFNYLLQRYENSANYAREFQTILQE